jgi:hypothetical protein
VIPFDLDAPLVVRKIFIEGGCTPNAPRTSILIRRVGPSVRADPYNLRLTTHLLTFQARCGNRGLISYGRESRMAITNTKVQQHNVEVRKSERTNKHLFQVALVPAAFHDPLFRVRVSARQNVHDLVSENVPQ